MIFNFNVLGIIIIFILLCIYYSKDTKLTSEVNTFISMMIVAYLVELLSLGNFITMKIDGSMWLFSKFYLILLNMYYSLMLGYFLVVVIKDKYLTKDSIIKNKINSVKIVLFGFNIITSIIILISGININNNYIDGFCVFITYLLWILDVIVCGLICVGNKNSLKAKHYKHLVIIVFINLFLIALAFCFKNINIIGICPLIILLYMYLTIENIWERREEIIAIERDYSAKNNIDKVNFLTNLSHEIRVPLNTIDGFSQVIMNSDSLKSVKEDAKDIRLASQDLIEIINGLIDMASIENGKLEIINENYNVKDMFENIENIASSRLKDKKVALKVSLDKKMPEVLLGDQERIEQIILSVLNNSIKYTNKGTIKLNVDAIVSENLCRFKIIIEDTGSGINNTELRKIFDIDSKKKNNKLGLIVAKELVDLMDGKIDIDSTLGQGTTVVIVLDQKMVHEDAKVVSKKKKEIVPFDGKNSKVLVVDDNKLNIKVATKLLEPYNIFVVEAYSGEEALNILDKDTDFSLILMDDLMPNLSGTETLDILKKIERVDGFDIPVVVLTANAVTGVKNKYLDKGFDDYLSKPIDRYELDRVLNKYVKK